MRMYDGNLYIILHIYIHIYMWFVCNMSTLMLPWCDCMSTLAQTACSVALWYKGLAVGGLWFSLVSDTKTFAESHSWEENTGSAADFIWWEDRDLPFTFQLVGPLHFFAIRDCGFLGYQWEGEKSLSHIRLYIYIYIYCEAPAKNIYVCIYIYTYARVSLFSEKKILRFCSAPEAKSNLLLRSSFF